MQKFFEPSKANAFLYLFGLILYVPVNTLSVLSGRVFNPGLTSTKQGLMCLAQRHNAVMVVRFESMGLWSRVKHSTTEPLSDDGHFPILPL